MHLKLSDLSLELNLSIEWSTKLREWERRKGELSLLFRRATRSQKKCSIQVVPSKTKETRTYSVASEVSVPGTGTSGPTRSDCWSLGPSRSDRCERLGPVGSSTRTSGQRTEENPDTRGHVQRLLCGLPFMDQNFLLLTETSGHTPEVFSQTRAHLSQPNQNFLSGWPELRVRHRKYLRKFRSCILSTISKLVRMLTSSSELRIRWSCTFRKAYSEGYTIYMDTQSKS